MKKIFISYVFEDRSSFHTVTNWKNQGLPSGIEFISEEKDIRHEGESAVKSYLGSLIDKSNAIIILVGDDTHNHNYVEWEYNYAQNKGKKVAVFKIPNATGAAPKLLPVKETVKLTLSNLIKTISDWGWK